MKKAKKGFKIIFLSGVILFVALIFSCFGYYFYVTNSISLSTEALNTASSNTNFKVYDINNQIINPTSENYISIKYVKPHTKNAFISAEDKRFYNHNGVDYIRMCGALLSNIKSMSFSEGASTISQQLIKNTQLTSEKTISRKLKELKLTKNLEDNYSKEEILEMYLNNIYFGNGCYGIENASKHYFNKSASNLSISESALLAATINAPSVYDIENHPEKAIQRRNLILELMHKYGKISKEEMTSAQAEPINLNLTKLSNNHYVFDEIIEEACKILKVSESQLKNYNLNIHTYIDSKIQNEINEKIKSNFKNIESSPSIASIVIDNNTKGIVSITGTKKTLNSKKQPGSVIKPILVYAPAIEENMISPASKILDEKVDYNGYSPENADKKYHGYVSVRESVKHSYNVPAVKILNELGISKAQKFAGTLGIEFDKNDNNLAIALGGFTNGVFIKDICDAYSAFATNGSFSESKFIQKIEQNNKVLYQRKNNTKQVMQDSTAYLITDMLKDTSKSGTAKRLKQFDFNVASKTGTVGMLNSTKNKCAYNVAYTTKHTIISFFGDSTMPETINGSTHPTMLTKNILETLYKNSNPENFQKPDSVSSYNLNKTDYENNILAYTESTDNIISELFSTKNPPTKSENSLSLKLEISNSPGKKPELTFFASKNYDYKIIRKNKNMEEIISSIDNLNNSKFVKFEDKTALNNEIYEYLVEFCEKSTSKTYQTNSIKLKTY